jgi:hypothetical protein
MSCTVLYRSAVTVLYIMFLWEIALALGPNPYWTGPRECSCFDNQMHVMSIVQTCGAPLMTNLPARRPRTKETRYGTGVSDNNEDTALWSVIGQ